MSINLGGMQSVALLSGTIDYSQIVSQLYQAAKAPGDALNQSIQDAQLKSNDWAQISSLASAVQNALVALVDPSTFNSFTTTIGGANSGAITATASSGAIPGTYTINVTQVGSYATLTSSSGIGANPDLNNTQISQAVWNQPISTGTVTVNIGNASQQISIQSTDTINSIIGKINTAFGTTVISNAALDAKGDLTFTNASGQTVTFGSAGDTSNFFQVIGLAGTSVTSGGTGTSARLGHVQLTAALQSANFNTPVASGGTLTINGVGISYQPTDTLQSVINKINSSKAGVTASYNPLTDEVTLTSKTSQPITVQDTSGNLGAALGIDGTSNAGTPWTYTINGGPVQTSSSPTVTNALPGVSFTMQSTGTATLTVAQNTDTLTKNVNNFVNAFNALYNQLQSDTAKGAALQGDAVMAQLGFKYMNDVLTTGGSSGTVMQIGISNGAVGSAPGTTNSLQVDTNALITAFQNDPNQVISLLTGMAKQLNTDLTNLTGQFNSLTPISSMNSNMIAIAQSEQNMYSNQIKDIEQQQQTIYDQAQQEEQMLADQFTQLQQYQAQVAMQQSAIKALLGSLG